MCDCACHPCHDDPHAKFVPYVGQDPAPWVVVEHLPTRRWRRRRLRGTIQRMEETIAWERWKLAKVIHDHKLDQPGHSDGRTDGS